MNTKILAPLLIVASLAFLPAASAVATYSEGFESGSAPGWTFVGGVWNVNACDSASGSFSLAYSRPLTCDYDTDGASWGIVTSPPIVVEGPASFNFESAIQVPPGFPDCMTETDVAHVRLSVDQGPFDIIIPHVQCGQQDAWILHSIDLAPYVGSTVQIQFEFEANHHTNNFRGWFIDNVAITGPAYPTPELGSLALAGAGVAVVATVAVLRRRA